MMAFLRLALLAVMVGLISAEALDWSDCPQNLCRCKWFAGKKAADCMDKGFTSIPKNLSSQMQIVDLSHNSFTSLPAEAFESVGLINLHKLHLKSCGIQTIDKDAFKGLGILIDLDLSGNQIRTLHPGMFTPNEKLRTFYFNNNPIQKLENGLFSNLCHLQIVDMSNCELSEIGSQTFSNLPQLQKVILNGNRLTHMKLSTIENSIKLKSFELHSNPWRCDCHLKAFRDWTIEKHLYTRPTACSLPPQLENKFWDEINSTDFACEPEITLHPTGTIIATENPVTMSCHAVGYPPPEVFWVFNSRPIMNNSRYTIKASGDSNRWVNLTIGRARYQDRGDFKCVAKSAGGVTEKNITLQVNTDRTGYSPPGPVADSWPWIIGLITGILAVFIITLALLCCLCNKKERSMGKKLPGNGLSPNGDIPHHMDTEQEKCLLSGVNPVPKPARRLEVHHLSHTGGTDLLELNRNLLDEGTVTAPIACAEEDRSVDSKDTTPHRSRDKLDNEMYPPDLIAFQPGRGPNTSPAGSSASTAIDTSRFATHLGAQSPIQNPLHQCFGTLPYSRSHSPFSAPVSGPMVRQGYVTIPRRPRVPSWSSAPTPTLEDALSPIRAEPVYDNLGPRTTVDGSSVLSLNKNLDPEPQRNRSINPSSHTYVPFDERGTGILKPLPSPVERQCWPARAAEGGPGLKRVSSAEGPIGMTTSTPRPKTAPKPPPKPKKNGPLYEDEGEDGTEV